MVARGLPRARYYESDSCFVCRGLDTKIPLEIAEDFKNKDVSGVVKSIVREVTKQVKLTEGV